MKHWVAILALVLLVGCLPDSTVLVIPEGTEIGDMAPDFQLNDTNQQAMTLSQHRGSQNIVLVFHTGST